MYRYRTLPYQITRSAQNNCPFLGSLFGLYKTVFTSNLQQICDVHLCQLIRCLLSLFPNGKVLQVYLIHYTLTLQILHTKFYSAKPSTKIKKERNKKPHVGFIQVSFSSCLNAFDPYFSHYFFLHKQVSNVTPKRRKRIFSLFSCCQ